MTEEGNRRLWKRLDEMNEKLTALVAIGKERDKDCARNEACLAALKERLGRLELDRAKIVGGAIVLSVAANYVLKGLGLE